MLVMHLDQLASRDPAWLDKTVLAALSDCTSCVEWLRRHWDALPADCLPERGDEVPFARLLGSFFETSFSVVRTELGGSLLDARLRRQHSSCRAGGYDIRKLVGMAIKYLLASEGTRLDAGQARRFAESPTRQDDARVVAYMWELDRRARGKGKGPIVHRLWLSLPVTQRTALSVQMVDDAWAHILEAAQASKAHEV
jgi:hypothetical protein